jgi:hypothetical protein
MSLNIIKIAMQLPTAGALEQDGHDELARVLAGGPVSDRTVVAIGVIFDKALKMLKPGLSLADEPPPIDRYLPTTAPATPRRTRSGR